MSIAECPSCGAHYAPFVNECADCRVPLRRAGDTAADAGAEDAAALPEPAAVGTTTPLSSENEAGPAVWATREPRQDAPDEEPVGEFQDDPPPLETTSPMDTGSDAAAPDPAPESEPVAPLPEIGAFGAQPDEVLEGVETRGLDRGDEVVFELSEWGADMRTKAELLLTGQGVVHRWESGAALIVAPDDAEIVDSILDEVEFPMQLEAVEDEEADDEESYRLMADLFVAADRTMNAPGDLAICADLFDAATAVEGTPPPFGIDDEFWGQVTGAAAAVKEAIATEADEDVVEAGARQVRTLLRDYV